MSTIPGHLEGLPPEYRRAMEAPGKVVKPPLRAASAAFHVVKGRGHSRINGERFEWGPKDSFTAPVFSQIDQYAEEECFLVRIHDRPLQDKLGHYEERVR